MNFYTVKQSNRDPKYLDRNGYDSFWRVPMDDEAQGRRVASQGGGVVEVWAAELEGTYPVAEPVLPRLELAE